MAFLIHDFNNDGLIDINDAYDLLYVGKILKTESDYLMQQDAISIQEAIVKVKDKGGRKPTKKFDLLDFMTEATGVKETEKKK